MSADDKAINQIKEIARATGRNPSQVIKEALKETKSTNVDEHRPLKQITKDIYQDQADEINRLAQLSGLKAAVIMRKALDAGLGLPKKQEEG